MIYKLVKDLIIMADKLGVVEIMAPAGSYESLMAAINAGAGSIYFGVGKLNMRSKSANFELEDLGKIVNICNENDVKSYLTLNTVMYDEDLIGFKELCNFAKKLGVSAIIASDISVIEYARSIELEVHMSTQANISNIDAVQFYSKYADVIVLARELTLKQVKSICSEIKSRKICGPSGELVKVEVFIHGAMCVAISGKCYMSLAQYNSSANRGKCLQSCRRTYKVTDTETGDELIIDNKYVMSPKDMCTIKILDKLISAGVSVFKIEGRARGPDYVDTVVRQYKLVLDKIKSGEYSLEDAETAENELKKVFNRGFWENGYYLGKKLGEWSGAYGSKSTTKKIQVGKVINFFKKTMIAEVVIESGEIAKGDKIAITGPTTGIVYSDLGVILDGKDEIVEKLVKCEQGTIKLDTIVRKNDKLFVIQER